jgi:energy-converting hydrogenase Eha subunit C
MNLDRAGGFIWILGAMMLVASALIVRRRPTARMIRAALIWIAIFVILFAAAHWMDGRV